MEPSLMAYLTEMEFTIANIYLLLEVYGKMEYYKKSSYDVKIKMKKVDVI